MEEKRMRNARELSGEELNEVSGGRTRVKLEKTYYKNRILRRTAIWKWLDQCSEEEKKYIVAREEIDH